MHYQCTPIDFGGSIVVAAPREPSFVDQWPRVGEGRGGMTKKSMGIHRPTGSSPATLLQDKPRLIRPCEQEGGTPGDRSQLRQEWLIRQTLSGCVRIWTGNRGMQGGWMHRSPNPRSVGWVLKPTLHPFLLSYRRQSSKLFSRMHGETEDYPKKKYRLY